MIQQDLNAILKWTKEWLLSLNVNKCTVLHLGRKNPRLPYYLGNKQLKVVDTQKDLGVIISSDLKWEAHIVAIVSKVNSILYTIRKAFFNINKKTFIQIYKTYVRPLLEYAFQVWSPYFVKDIEMLEKVQRRATKLPRELRNLSYEQRLANLGLSTLKSRRERGDLIETYKILNKYYNIPNFEEIFSKKSNPRLRSYGLKLEYQQASSNPSKHFISNRVIQMWNALPEDVVTAESLNQFKNRLDKHQKDKERKK
ncbi:jg14526 [Pararge aegeria aegeria]|uniref:Jg14526 protein n=1 Tax=Pararge aegeria aegeria TaxID=348720 RepID=A0A8S4RXC8_9NEOP|nr:jg14526 [Pararge aegeria aegeria]